MPDWPHILCQAALNSWTASLSTGFKPWTELHLIVHRSGLPKGLPRGRCVFHAIFHARIPCSSWSQGLRFITRCRSSYQIGRSSS